MTLNEQQERAVRCQGHCVVAAGPGSGKTRVLVEKVAHLIAQGVKPNQIALTTFTKDSAAAARARLIDRVGKLRGRVVSIGTFHALCSQQLKASGQSVRIINASQSAHILNQIRQSSENELSLDDIRGAIELIKTSLTPPESASEIQRSVADQYNALLRGRGFFDFYDLLLVCVRGMQAESVNPLPVTQLLVDETQDVDRVQIAWIQAHLNAGATLTAVGDDDQSIYGWRNAQGYAGMELLREQNNAELIVLERNYRNPKELVQVGLALLERNKSRIEKALSAASDVALETNMISVGDPVEEAELIAEAGKNREYAVFARTRDYLNEIEWACFLAGTPYVRESRYTVFSHPTVAAVQRLLDALANVRRQEIQGLLKALAVDRDSWAHHAREHGLPGDPAVATLEGREIPFSDSTSVQIVRDLAQLLPEWHTNAQYDPDFSMHLAFEWLTRRLRHGIWKSRVQRLARSMCDAEGSLQERAAWLEQHVVSACNQKTGEGATPALRLVTLHSAKGLEFAHVWLAGLRPGLFPSESNPNLDEERRLLYVGLTRTERSLTVTYPAGVSNNPFLKELQAAGLKSSPQAQGVASGQEAKV